MLFSTDITESKNVIRGDKHEAQSYLDDIYNI